MTLVVIPARMAGLPRDKHGYPIFWTAYVDAHGVPDFRVLEMPRVFRALKYRRCGMCGEPISGRTFCLIGARDNVAELRGTDPPMHEDCARFALAVCPFLSGSSTRRSGKALGSDTVELATDFERDAPPEVGLIFTRSYERGWDETIRGFRYATPFRVEWQQRARADQAPGGEA